MKRQTKIILLLLTMLLVLSACTPYPRYKKYSPNTPEERYTKKSGLSTDEYLRFGWILQKYLGKPYSGKSKYQEGIDCSNFVRQVYKEYDKTVLPRTVKNQYEEGRTVPRRKMRFGDLLFFETIRGRVSHVGIYIGYNEFIHASSSRGVIVSHVEEKYWAKRLVGVRRLLK